MTTNKTVKAQAEELAKKFIKAESVDMYDDSKLTDLIEGFLTKLTEAEKDITGLEIEIDRLRLELEARDENP